MTMATERRAPVRRADDPWLNSNQAAEYLGYSSKTLAKWRQLGTGRGPKFTKTTTGQPRYRRSELDRWLKRQGRA